MNAIEITIISIVLMIGLGYFLKRIDFLSEKDIDPLNKIVMYILMPCMIFFCPLFCRYESITYFGNFAVCYFNSINWFRCYILHCS